MSRNGFFTLLLLVVVVFPFLLIIGCDREANVASRNLSKSADFFEINRRIVFYNGITGHYILQIEGFCPLGNFDTSKELSVTCKIGQSYWEKHLGRDEK